MKHQNCTLGRSTPQSRVLDMYCPGHRDRAAPGKFSRCTGCRTRVFRAEQTLPLPFEKGA